MRYLGIPDPERVVADIQYDLDLRYGDTPGGDDVEHQALQRHRGESLVKGLVLFQSVPCADSVL